jgi:hypothetical protein
VGNKHSWTWRYPIAVSSGFGLLHGFGFAAVLKEVGLPQTERVMALLCFNLGVEIGQLLFIVLLLIAAARISMAAKRFFIIVNRAWLKNIINYVIGGVAAFWFISRMILI